MNIQSESIGTVTEIRLEGNLCGGDDSKAVELLLDGLLAEGRREFEVDLQKVGWINSSGLGFLYACHRLIRSKGGRFTLKNLNHRVRQILEVSRFLEVLDVREEPGRAVPG